MLEGNSSESSRASTSQSQPSSRPQLSSRWRPWESVAQLHSEPSKSSLFATGADGHSSSSKPAKCSPEIPIQQVITSVTGRKATQVVAGPRPSASYTRPNPPSTHTSSNHHHQPSIPSKSAVESVASISWSFGPHFAPTYIQPSKVLSPDPITLREYPEERTRPPLLSPRAPPSQAVGRPNLPKVFFQDACLKHKYIRSKDKSNVYERPERIRAVKVGVAAAYAHLEFAAHEGAESSSVDATRPPFDIIRSTATIEMHNHPATQHVHGGGCIGYPVEYKCCWTNDLANWCYDSTEYLAEGESEIPDCNEQDLYLCPESFSAFEGALATVCEAIDAVMTVRPLGARKQKAGSCDSRAFVVIRPPGHHCSEEDPMGFGFVNNVAVGTMHAFKEHKIQRVVIFDYDLHHGNGTQGIVRRMNERRVQRDRQGKDPFEPLVFYGSMHDILSYPCEDSDSQMVKDASLNLHGEGGEWIENLHLKSYVTEAQFWDDYDKIYSGLFKTATKFIESTGSVDSDDVIVFISSGFDASEHETEDMSRHGRKVPTSFYHRFTRDACRFAEKYANGRIISLLEGGYSDLALMSGALAHVTALADVRGVTNQDWWSMKRLAELEKATKKRRGRPPRVDTLDGWLRRTVELFEILDKPSSHTTTMPLTVPRLTEEVLASLSPSTRKSAMKRPLPKTSIQTRAKQSRTALNTGRVHLQSSIESESEESDESPLARRRAPIKTYGRPREER